MPEAVIFDLDGVIADTHSTHRDAWRQLLAEERREVRSGSLEFILEGRRRDEIVMHFFGRLPNEEVFRLGARKDELFRMRSTALKALPGAMEFIDQLQEYGIPKAVATSAGRQRTQRILEQLQLTEAFTAVVTGDDVARSKPDPSIFQVAAAALRVDCAGVLVIEDSPAGVQAAKSAGMTCLGIASSAGAARLFQAGADHVLPTIPALPWAEVKSLLGLSIPKMAFASGSSAR